MRNIYLVLIIILITPLFFVSCISSNNNCEKYIGNWVCTSDSIIKFNIKKAGDKNYIIRFVNHDECINDLFTYKEGVFILKNTGEELFYTNGDTLETKNKSFIKVK